MDFPYKPSTKAADLSNPLAALWHRLYAAFSDEFPDYDLRLTCTHRPPELQLMLFAVGRTQNRVTKRWTVTDENKVLTNCDGEVKMSKHNFYPARAFDVAVIDRLRNVPVWVIKERPVPEPWKRLVELGAQIGLLNGGSWKSPPDWPHFELV